MYETGNIEIIINGKRKGRQISPAMYEGGEFISLLIMSEKLFGNQHPELITYIINSDSIRNYFETSLSYVKVFNSILEKISANASLEGIDEPQAEAIEQLQWDAVRQGASITIKTSEDNTAIVRIDPTTDFRRNHPIWVDTQVYLYGEIIDAGGKDNPHIHLNTDKGVITLHTSKAFLQQFDKNLLYKKFGVRVAARQDAVSGETDYSSAQVLEIIEYEPKYDEKYLNNLIEQATPHWDGVNVDTWLREVRGNYDE